MFQKFFATGTAVVCSLGAWSQDSTSAVVSEPAPKPTISGYVDVYYRYNFGDAKHAGQNGNFNNYTSFTNSQNSFELGMASVKLEHTIGKVGVVADLGFGKRAEDFSYNDKNTMLAIKQAYLTYAVSDKLKLTAGSWATHVGYELVDPYLNRNYSMSYMFSYGPFFHTGVKADLTLGKSGLMFGVVNPNDLKSANFQQKMFAAQYSLAASDKVKLYLNYIGGKLNEDVNLQQFDVVVTGTVTDKFSLGYNGTINSQKAKTNGVYGGRNKWWGSALYFNIDPTPAAGVTLRTEYLSDADNILGFDGGVFEGTLSLDLKAGPLTFIPEFRVDTGKQEIFFKKEGAGTKSTATLLFAAVYKF